MQMEPLAYMSKRFMLERFLGLTEDEIKENEEMWREERDEPDMQTQSGQDLRSVGITPGGLESDVTTGEEIAGMVPAGADAGITGGAPVSSAPGGVMPAAGAAPAA
jgi:hypothetical protein